MRANLVEPDALEHLLVRVVRSSVAVRLRRYRQRLAGGQDRRQYEGDDRNASGAFAPKGS